MPSNGVPPGFFRKYGSRKESIVDIKKNGIKIAGHHFLARIFEKKLCRPQLGPPSLW